MSAELSLLHIVTDYSRCLSFTPCNLHKTVIRRSYLRMAFVRGNVKIIIMLEMKLVCVLYKSTYLRRSYVAGHIHAKVSTILDVDYIGLIVKICLVA